MSDGALKEVPSSYINSEKQWLAFAFVEIDNLLMDSFMPVLLPSSEITRRVQSYL